MIEQNDLMLSRSDKILSVLPPVILILSNIFLFGPFTIYQGNIDEFGISFTSIIKGFLLPSLILFSILSVVGILLPEKLHKRYVSILFIFGILIWLQGNIFLWDYGVFGKGVIDWTKDVWHGWVDTSIWVVLLISSIIFYRRLYKITRSASIVFVSLQAVLLVFGSFQQPDVWKERASSSQPPEAIFQFSSKQNVIHVILDEFQSDVFQKIIEGDPEHYDNVFEGFTYYKETTGPFPTTVMSIPAFLSGQVYQSDIPIQDYLDTVYKGKTIPNVLYDKGYEVDLAAEQAWYGYGRHTNWYYIPVPYGVAIEEFEQANSAFIMNLIVFRHSPHFLKEALFEKELDLSMVNLKEKKSYEALRHFSHKALLEDLIDRMSVRRDKPLYKLIHLTTTHWPTVLDENCEYAGEILPFTWENIKIQAKCSLDHFIQFLDRLKSLGIYDSSLIIVHADHGYWKIDSSLHQVSLQNLDKELRKDFNDEEDFAQKVCASAPLLAIKPPHSKGRLKVSSALVSLTDIPAIVSSILNLNEKFNDRSVLEIDSNEIRERRFYYYYELNRREDKYFDRIDEYLIKGKVRDRESWQFVSLHLPPGILNSTRKIVFGTDESSRFLRFGWSGREMDPDKDGLTFSWAVGKSASIFLALPKTQIRLTANVKTLLEKGRQSVTVKVDGREVGTWKNSKQWEWERKSVIIESDENRPTVSDVEFVFSTHRKPDERDYRQLAVLFESITLEEMEK